MNAVAPELDLANRAMNHLMDVVNSLGAADLDRPTPCPAWSVRDVLAHVAGTAQALAGFARTGRRELPDRLIPLANPIGDTDRAIAGLRAELAENSGDPAAASRAAGDAAVEFTTHAWDLDPARAIPDELAREVLAFVSPVMNDELRQQFFAAQVDVGPGVTASDALVAFLGRDPAVLTA